MRLSNTVALVTGAGRGIGRGIALAFAREGASVIVATLDNYEANSVAGEITALDRVALPVSVDVSEEAQVAHMIQLSLDRFGRIDVLVNNVGTLELPGDLLGTTPEAWDHTMAVNVRSVYLCCRAVLPGMIARGSGRIINIASTAGLRGLPDRAVYCASKHAVVGLTKALAIDQKPHGIAVNAICPGAVETPLTAITRPDADKTDWMGPHDIANVAVFLASDEAKSMTGSIVEVSGWSG